MHAARKDADTHFQLNDESSPVVSKSISSQAHSGENLYQDPVSDVVEGQKASNNASTSTNNNRRGNDFGAHYSMTDSQQNENVRPPSNRGTRDDMKSSWAYETPPAEKKGYKTAGDGMGGRKGSAPSWAVPEEEKKMYKTAGDGMGGRATAGGGRSWGIGDDSDPEVDANFVPSARGAGGRGRRAQAEAGAAFDY